MINPKNTYLTNEVTRTFAFDRERDEVAAVDQYGNVILHAKHSPVCSEETQLANALKTSNMDLPQISDLESYLRSLFRGARVIAYNAEYEVKNAPTLFGLASSVICVMERAAHTGGKWNYKHGSYEWVPLLKAVEIAGLDKPVGFPHRAVADARATMALWLHLEARDNHIITKYFPERLTNKTNSARS